MQRSNELRDEKQKRKVAQLRRELQSQDAERIEADHEMLMRDVQVAWEVATRAEKAQREAEADQILHYVLGYSDDEGTQSVTEGQLRSELRQMTNTEQQSSHRVSELEQELAVLRDTAEMLSVELQASKNAQAQRHEMEDNGAEAIRKLEVTKRLNIGRHASRTSRDVANPSEALHSDQDNLIALCQRSAISGQATTGFGARQTEC